MHTSRGVRRAKYTVYEGASLHHDYPGTPTKATLFDGEWFPNSDAMWHGMPNVVSLHGEYMGEYIHLSHSISGIKLPYPNASAATWREF